MTDRKYRTNWLKWHATYEKRATTELLKVFRKWGNAIELTDDYSSSISKAIRIEDLNEAYYNIYYSIGIVHGKRMMGIVNEQIKSDFFESFYENLINIFVRNYGAKRIVSVQRSFFEYINDIVKGRFEEGYDLYQTGEYIKNLVNRRYFYQWQAERIARTESTAAANYSSNMLPDVMGYEMEKKWISATDSRTRRHPDDRFDHYEMNGVRIPRNDKFVLKDMKGGYEQLMFPGDPQGSAANVIHCRCSLVVVPKRDSDGNLIRLG